MTGDNIFQLSLVLHLCSALLFLTGRQRWALWVLVAGGVSLRYYFATIDPFLHDWDERFHALVAKNLSQHWLLPTLIDQPVLPYAPRDWTTEHIWLHKQPLFLWQMALSIRIFGATEFAVRLPSLVMTSVLIIIVYQIGRQVFSGVIGYIAAFILSCYEPLLEMNSGMLSMEHNDIAFVFYITLSVWAWIYFEQRRSRRYLLLMGFFAGCAVLCKWLTGLLVFSGFIFYHLFLTRDFFTKNTLVNLAKALGICMLTFLPWQLYILCQYPAEAHFEYAYNSNHFFRVVEGHRHEAWFYLNILPDYYRGLQYLIGVALLVTLLPGRRSRLSAALSFMFILVYAFFTIAQTKLPSYVMMVVPIGLLLISAVIGGLLISVWHRCVLRYIAGSVLFIALLLRFINWPLIVENHFATDTWQGFTRAYLQPRADMYRSVAGHLPPSSVIVNLEPHQEINAMFYIGMPAYSECGIAGYHFLRAHHYNIIYGGDTLPSYAAGDTAARLLKSYVPQ
ncbi:MAG: glycosyltransferase family 39 protein [Bacteroidetes bacterium]|nr:glycosyltransferase family 39 protein [Bacteroidota bacterium]